MSTAMEELIAKQVQASTTVSLNRAVDRIADSMTEEILRDQVFRARFMKVVQAAIEKVWTDMQKDRAGQS
jgi:hypothetical protein